MNHLKILSTIRQILTAVQRATNLFAIRYARRPNP